MEALKHVYWDEKTTYQLINSRVKLDNIFTSKHFIKTWTEVAKEMESENGVPFSASKCKKKWENLVKKYKDLKQPTAKSAENSVDTPLSWPYYEILDDFLGAKFSISLPVLVEYGEPPSPLHPTVNHKVNSSPPNKKIKSQSPATSHPPPPTKRRKTQAVSEEEYRARFLEFLEKEDRRRDAEERRREQQDVEILTILREILSKMK